MCRGRQSQCTRVHLAQELFVLVDKLFNIHAHVYIYIYICIHLRLHVCIYGTYK